MTDGTEKSLLSSTINAFNKIDKTTATKRKAEQYESCSAFVRHIDTKRYTLHNLIQFNSTLLAERYTFNRLQATCCAGCGTWQRLTVGTLSRPDFICTSITAKQNKTSSKKFGYQKWNVRNISHQHILFKSIKPNISCLKSTRYSVKL